jgi:hypothetical protein
VCGAGVSKFSCRRRGLVGVVVVVVVVEVVGGGIIEAGFLFQQNLEGFRVVKIDRR